MTKKLNKVRYIELLKKDESLRKEEKLLFHENKGEYPELLSYGVILENQIFYNRRYDYIALIEEYVTKEIDSLFFRLQFFHMQREDRKTTKDLKKDFKRLSTVSIDSKPGKFSPLIRDIFAACDALKFDSEPEEAYGITETQFRAFLEKTLLQVQKYLDQ